VYQYDHFDLYEYYRITFRLYYQYDNHNDNGTLCPIAIVYHPMSMSVTISITISMSISNECHYQYNYKYEYQYE